MPRSVKLGRSESNRYIKRRDKVIGYDNKLAAKLEDVVRSIEVETIKELKENHKGYDFKRIGGKLHGEFQVRVGGSHRLRFVIHEESHKLYLTKFFRKG